MECESGYVSMRDQRGCVCVIYVACVCVCVVYLCVSPAPSSYVSNNHMSVITQTFNFSLDYKSREPVMVVCFSSTQ